MENITKRKKQKKKLEPWKIVALILGICVTIGILIIGFIYGMCFLFSVYIKNMPKQNMSEVSCSQDLYTKACSVSKDAEYFDTFESAREDADATNLSGFKLSQDLLELEDEDGITYIGLYEAGEKMCISIDSYAKSEDKYSDNVENTQYELTEMIPSKSESAESFVYDYDDEMVYSIMHSVTNNQTSFANEEILVPYGLTDNADIYKVTVMGEKPTDIIPFESGGTTYYFWYYNSETIDKQLRDNVGGTYVYQSVIDALQIKVDNK